MPLTRMGYTRNLVSELSNHEKRTYRIECKQHLTTDAVTNKML